VSRAIRREHVLQSPQRVPAKYVERGYPLSTTCYSRGIRTAYDIAVGCRPTGRRLLHQAKEEFAPMRRHSPVETEREFVQVVVQRGMAATKTGDDCRLKNKGVPPICVSLWMLSKFTPIRRRTPCTSLSQNTETSLVGYFRDSTDWFFGVPCERFATRRG
jgi:hypothetical protein